MRKVVKVVAALVGLLVVLVVGLVLLLQTSAVSNRVKDLIVPKVSAALGRDVQVKDASLGLFPPKVSLKGTTVAGRPGEPPLVDVESFEVGLAFVPLVTSLGKDVRVTGITLVKPSLNLVRAKDGTWNYEGLGGEKAPREQAPAPATPSERSFVVEQASIQDGAVKLIDHATGDKAAVAISKIDLSADHVGLGQPLHAKLSAAIAGAEKNFEAEIRSPKLPEAAGAGAPPSYPELSGSLALKGLDLAKLRAFMPPKVTGMMTGGRADADAKLTTQDRKYHVDGSGKLSQLKLRGDPAQGSFDLHAVADPASGAAHAAIEKLAVKGPGVDLGGSLAADAKPARLRFAIKGPLLDLGEVLALMPPEQKKQEDASAGLTPEMRKSLEAADVAGTIDIDKVVRGGLVATGFKANAALEKGLFVLKDARADFFGGRVDAAGTRLDLAEAEPKWNLKAKLESVDMAKALTSLGGAAPLAGKVTGALDLTGAGVDWNALKKALTGNGGITLKDGALTTTDLGDKVLGAVSQGLKAAGRSGVAGAVGGVEGGKTTLKDLVAQFTVKDGAMALSKPLSFTAPFGAANLGGKIGLGGDLALDGKATISKEALQGIASGLPIGSGLDVPLGLGGTLTAPSVNVNAQQAVAGLVSGVAKQQVDAVKERALRQGRTSVQDALKGFGIGR
jgi:AsmA protein